MKCEKCKGQLIRDLNCKPFLHGPYHKYLHRCNKCGYVKRLGEDLMKEKSDENSNNL